MSVTSNVTVISSNANVYVYNVTGIAVGDVVQGANIARSDDVRVRTIYATANVVKVNQAVSTYTNENLSFTTLVEGQSLYQTNSIQSVFLRNKPGYLTDIDPRLPKHDQLTAPLTIWANTEIKVSNISLFPDPGQITANNTVTGGILANSLLVPVSSTSSISVGEQVITTNIVTASNVIVNKIYANGNILINGNVSNATISSGEVIYLYPKTVFVRSLLSITSNALYGNVLFVPLETLDSVFVGSVASTANIASQIELPNDVKVAKIFSANSTVQLEGITANLTIAAGEYIEFNSRPTVGAVRIKGEVIWYERVWTANSTLTNLTRNVAGTPNSTISGNINAGNLVSILGLQTLSS